MDEPRVCSVDHDSITSYLRPGADGKTLTWTACPICGLAIEPKLIQGILPVVNRYRGELFYPLGRGPITMSQKAQLDFVGWRNRNAH